MVVPPAHTNNNQNKNKMHVWCPPPLAERFVVEHEKIDTLSLLPLSEYEGRSLLYTKSCGVVTVTLTLDDEMSYVMRIHDIQDILDKMNDDSVMVFHYTNTEQIEIRDEAPDPSRLVGNDVLPSLPCTSGAIRAISFKIMADLSRQDVGDA